MTGVALRTVLGFLRRCARREGIPDGRSGAVAIVQRFGGALNLNVHLHALVLDGAFALDGSVVAFHRVLAPRAAWRPALVPGASHGVDASHVEPSMEADEDASRVKPSRAGAYQWAS